MSLGTPFSTKLTTSSCLGHLLYLAPFQTVPFDFTACTVPFTQKSRPARMLSSHPRMTARLRQLQCGTTGARRPWSHSVSGVEHLFPHKQQSARRARARNAADRRYASMTAAGAGARNAARRRSRVMVGVMIRGGESIGSSLQVMNPRGSIECIFDN